jgi:hypothetical protein
MLTITSKYCFKYFPTNVDRCILTIFCIDFFIARPMRVILSLLDDNQNKFKIVKEGMKLNVLRLENIICELSNQTIGICQ